MSAGYPMPRETPTNAPMLAAWREGRLALQRCEACRHTFFYPRSVCPQCWSDGLRWVDASGRGRIVSFSRVHRGVPEAFKAEVPIVLAEIETDEGAVMIARVICEDAQAVQSGMRVRILPLPHAARYPLPTFAPDFSDTR